VWYEERAFRSLFEGRTPLNIYVILFTSPKRGKNDWLADTGRRATPPGRTWKRRKNRRKLHSGFGSIDLSVASPGAPEGKRRDLGEILSESGKEKRGNVGSPTPSRCFQCQGWQLRFGEGGGGDIRSQWKGKPFANSFLTHESVYPHPMEKRRG